MNKKLMINYLVAPIALVLVAIITLVLFFTDLNWKYYLIGSMVGFLTHGMMLKQSHRMERMAKLDPEQTIFNPKKSGILWLLLRMLVTAGVFVALVFMSDIKNNKNQAIIDILIALGGYVTLKIVFIISLIFTREKVEDK